MSKAYDKPVLVTYLVASAQRYHGKWIQVLHQDSCGDYPYRDNRHQSKDTGSLPLACQRQWQIVYHYHQSGFPIVSLAMGMMNHHILLTEGQIVSFSLTIGITPISKISSRQLTAFKYWPLYNTNKKGSAMVGHLLGK